MEFLEQGRDAGLTGLTWESETDKVSVGHEI